MKINNYKNSDDLYSKIHNFFTIDNYILIFVIGSIAGWIFETIIYLFRYHQFCSVQCVLYGPFIPVYGIGAILFMFIYYKIKNLKVFFLIAMFAGAFLEFLYSYCQEKLFGTVFWEYNDYFLNIQGRTSIVHAIFWGIIGFLFIRYLLPLIFSITEKISNKVLKNIIVIFIIAFMTFNFIMTFLTSYREYERNRNILPKNKLDVLLDKYYPNEKLQAIYCSRIKKNFNNIN